MNMGNILETGGDEIVSFKSALIYDMDYIVKEIEGIETKELEVIQKELKSL